MMPWRPADPKGSSLSIVKRGLNLLAEPMCYVPLLFFALLLLMILLTKSSFYFDLYFTVFLFAGLSGAWNIIGGFGGQLSLGHSAFVGIGAYTSSLLFVKCGIPPLLGMGASIFLALLLAVIIGLPCFRLKGPFFSLATIAIAEVLQLLAVYFRGLTEGSEGLSIPFKPSFLNLTFQSKAKYAVVAYAFMVLVLVVSLWIKRSRLGFQLIALRDEDQAAESLGVDTAKAKMLALLFSAGLTSIGGTIYAQYILYLEPHAEFSMASSINLALISMVGGLGTVIGPIIGAFLLIPMQEILRNWMGGGAQGLYFIIYGLLLLAVVMFMPHGIIAFFSRQYEGLISRLPGTRKKIEERPPAGAVLRREETSTVSAHPAPFLLEVQSVSKVFGGVQALMDVSFSVRRGEIFGIIGPNGAGKSTLFNILAGAMPADRGEVRFRGDIVSRVKKPHLMSRRGIGRTFQIVKPFEQISVLENVIVGAFCKESDSREALGIAHEVIDFVGISDKRSFSGNSLTLSDRKKLEMARALATMPEVLLLDEVMAGLTPSEVNNSVELIHRIRDYGITIVIVEHVMQAIMSLSDRIMVIAEGKKIIEATPQEVVTDKRVIKAYLGDGYESLETG